jgi:hypothetical protein
VDNSLGGFPVLFSNSTVSQGNLLNISAPDRSVGTLGQPEAIVAATGKCPATGIDHNTNFFKSTWPSQGKVFDCTDPRFGMPPCTTAPRSSDYYLHGQISCPDATLAAQACINAASLVPEAVAYFPTAIYSINTTILLPKAPHHYYVGGTRDNSVFSMDVPVALQGKYNAHNAVTPSTFHKICTLLCWSDLLLANTSW